jgi:hypothetical protein
MVPIRTYLFGGGAALALIAGALAAFLLITAVVSEGTLQDGTRAVAAQPPDTLNIGGPGRGPGGLGGDGEPTQGGSGDGALHSAPGPTPSGEEGDGEVSSGTHARGRPWMSLSSGRWPMPMPRARESSAVPGQVRRMR